MKSFIKLTCLFLATFIVAYNAVEIAHAQFDGANDTVVNNNSAQTSGPGLSSPTPTGLTGAVKPSTPSIVPTDAESIVTGQIKTNSDISGEIVVDNNSTAKAASAVQSTAATAQTSNQGVTVGVGSALNTPLGVSCSDLDFFTHFVFCVGNGVGYLIFSLVNYLLSIVGWLFNIVIERTVFGFGAFFSGNAGIIAGWTVIRDVCNIALLFGFILIGITTILELQQYEVKKTLPRLIIFAILLNFSLLASQTIIDTSNIFASTLYGQGNACTTGDTTTCGSDQGISNSIMFESGAGSVFNLQEGSFGSPGFGFYMLTSIFAIVLMVVLLAGAILLITRAVVLAFLMVLSPIGFAAMAIPPLEKYAKMWWSKLLSQSFFAPLYLLLIFISLKIGATLTSGSASGVGSFGTLVTGPDSSTLDQMLVFGIMIGFLIASLMIAKQLGMVGAQFATNIATKAVSYPFAVAGRNTVGRGASWVGKKWDAKMGQWSDEKKATPRQLMMAKLLRGSGADEVIAGGFTGAASAKMGGFASYADRQKEMAERKRVTDRAARGAQLKAAIDLGTPAGDEEVKKLLQQMNESEIEQSEIIQKGTVKQIEAVARALSPEKFEQVMKNKEYAQDKLDKMAAARFGTTNEANAKDLTVKDLEQLAKTNPEKFKKIVEATDTNGRSYLREDQLDALKGSDRLTKEQRDSAYASTIPGRVESHIDADRTADASALAAEMTPSEKSKLRKRYVTDPAVMATYTRMDMNTLLTEKKIKDPDAVINWLKKNASAKQKADINGYLDANKFDAGLWGATSI